MASSSSAFVPVNASKRRRCCISLRKPAQVNIQQNIQLVPPVPVQAGFDEEGRLPESLPPTPIIDLVTESETEADERTPRHIPEPQPEPQRSSMAELNPEAIEREDHFTPPTLQPLRTRGGKNMAAVLASVREVSPVSSPSHSPQATAPASPTSSQSSRGTVEEGEDGFPPASPTSSEEVPDVFSYVEAAARRLEKTKRRMSRLAPDIRQRREAASAAIGAIRREIAALEQRLREETATVQQCDAALLKIDMFVNL